MSIEHTNQLLAHLRGDELLRDNIVDAAELEAAPRPAPYVVVYSDLGTESVERASSELPNRIDHEWQIDGVGRDRNQAQFWGQRVRDRLRGFHPAVTGWDSGVIRNVDSFKAERDASFSEQLFRQPDIYACTSRRRTPAP